MSKSAACGAWQHLDGTNAHEFCTGRVNLPAPDDVCTCECHYFARYVEFLTAGRWA